MHYLNNAGAGLMSNKTLESVIQHMKNELQFGPYGAAQMVKDLLDDLYAVAGRVLGTSSDTISMHDSASRAWNAALYGADLHPGDEIVTLSSEFGTNLVSIFHYAKRIGAQVYVVPCEVNGAFALEKVESRVAKGAALIALSHVAAHGSIINPVKEIGEIAKKHGAKYMIDGCQAIGQLPVDVSSFNCDVYTCSGRKWLRGPRGTAFLHVRKGAVFQTPQVDLASADLSFDSTGRVKGVDIRKDGKQFELWERNVANFLGLRTALLSYLELDVEKLSRNIELKGNVLRRAVTSNPNLRLIGNDSSLSGVVGFITENSSREDAMKHALDAAGIVYSTMADWDCPLHFPRGDSTKIFRLSPHYYTPDETIEHTESTILDFS